MDKQKLQRNVRVRSISVSQSPRRRFDNIDLGQLETVNLHDEKTDSRQYEERLRSYGEQVQTLRNEIQTLGVRIAELESRIASKQAEARGRGLRLNSDRILPPFFDGKKNCQ